VNTTIIALWEHLRQVWNFHNGVYHAENRGRIARYKLEAQLRAMATTWERHQELQGILKTFQHQHFYDHERIANLHYASKHCWNGLAKLFLDES
jgi:dGTP triphosphohydrolase